MDEDWTQYLEPKLRSIDVILEVGLLWFTLKDTY